MTLVTTGLDAMAAALGGDLAGHTGSTTSAPTATTVTDTGGAFGTLTGHIVVMGGTYGVIVSNTTTVLTIDTWYAVGAPATGGVTTPSTGVYSVLPGQAPYVYMGLSQNGTVSVGDTGLTTEYATTAGGLIRKLATYAHTAGTSTYTLAATFLVNTSDNPNLPYTIASIGIFNTLTHGTGRMLFETQVSPTATVSASGDQVTLTDTVTV